MAEKSSIGDAVVADAVGARMKELLGVALEGIATGGLHSTFGYFAVTVKLARRTFSAGRVRKEMQQMRESSIAEYGRWEGTDGAFARPP